MVEYYYYQYQQRAGVVVVDRLNILKSILHYPEHSLLTTKIEVCHFVTEWLTGD